MQKVKLQCKIQNSSPMTSRAPQRLEYFLEKKYSFVLVADGEIVYKSKLEGLVPLVSCLSNHRQQMQGAVIYDKIVGRAAALLLVLGGVKKVLTPLISHGALAHLRKNGVVVEYGKVVENISNRAGTDMCPMEKLSAGKSAEEFLPLL